MSNRTNTIRAREETHIVSIERNNYEKALKAVAEKSWNDLILFLRKLPVFQGFTKSYTVKLLSYLKPQRYIRNAIVFRQGDPSGKVYIVREGEFQESAGIRLNENLDDAGCESFLSEKTQKLSDYRASTLARRVMHRSPYMRNVDVLFIGVVDSTEFGGRNPGRRRLLEQ